MVIKIFYFTIAIFSVCMVFLMLQNPYEEIITKNDIKIANTVIYNITNYESNETGIIRIYQAKNVKRYKDKDEFSDFYAQILDDTNSTLNSKKVISRKNILEFLDDVIYKNTDNLKINSKLVLYDLKDKNLTIPRKFKITQNQNKIVGKNLIYDTQNKQIYAKKVKLWYLEN